MKRTLLVLIVVSLGLLSGSVLSKGKGDFPEYTTDGLKRIHNPDSLTVVYAEPGANLVQYQRIYITEPFVAFKKDWQREQNRNVGTRVSASDMDRIKKSVAELFMEVFTKELSDSGYELTQERAEDVLTVRPAVLDLDLNVPDSMNATMGRSYERDSGSMTLYIELYDSETGDLLAKAMDKRVARHRHYLYLNSGPAIRSEARRMMKPWAEALRKGLDRAHQETGEDK